MGLNGLGTELCCVGQGGVGGGGAEGTNRSGY